MRKSFWMISVTHMLVEVFFLTQIALIPVYAREFGLSLVEVSLVATFPGLVRLLMNIPAGFLADRFDARHLLSLSMVIQGVSAIFVSQTKDFWSLVFWVSLMGVSSPIYHISGLSQISKLKGRERSRFIGYHHALGNLGCGVGVLSLSFFLATLGWRSTYLFWPVPILVWGLIMLRTPLTFETEIFEESEGVKGDRSSRLSQIFSAAFLTLLFAVAICSMGTRATSTFMTTYLVEVRGLSETTASLIFGFGPFLGILGSLNGGYLGEKMGAKKSLSLVILSSAILLGILAYISQVYLLTLIYVLYVFFNKSIWSPMGLLVADITPENETGMGFSVYFFTQGLISSFTPTLVAVVIKLTSVWIIFPFSVALLVTSIITLQFLDHPRTAVS